MLPVEPHMLPVHPAQPLSAVLPPEHLIQRLRLACAVLLLRRQYLLQMWVLAVLVQRG